MTTGKLISDIRESNGVLQKELARAINVDPVVLNRIEKDKRPARGDEIKAIADYFDVTADYLLGRKTANYSPPLSDEQSSLLKKYDALADDGRQLIQSLLNSLLISHPKKSSGVIQGDNKFVNGSGETNYLTT